MGMKKTRVWVRILCLALAALMILGVIVSAVMGASAEEYGDRYLLDMYYHEDSQAFEVSQKLIYRNRTGGDISSVRFHVYENAYRRYATAPFVNDELTDAYPEGFAPGGVDFVSVTVNEESAEWGVYGEGEELLRVECPLKAGESCEIGFHYYVLLPVCRGRCGAGALDVRLAYFYPVAAVWDPLDGDFEMEPLNPLGDSLYSETAEYKVTLDVPATYRVAATGKTVGEEKLENNRKRLTVEAEANQFALTMSRRYSEYAGERATVCAVDAAGARTALETAESALSWLEDMFGPCPHVNIAQSDLMDAGVSYPGLIGIRSDLFGRKRELQWEVVRQAAHQYFSGLVGSNPADNPFLDDGVCEYVALLYFESRGGYSEYIDRLNERCLSALQITLPGALTVDAGTYLFDSREDYDAVIRARGCAVLHEMRSLMGEEGLLAGLRLYVQRFSGKNATLADFAQALDDATGRRWDELLVGHMRSIGEYANQEMKWYE